MTRCTGPGVTRPRCRPSIPAPRESPAESATRRTLGDPRQVRRPGRPGDARPRKGRQPSVEASDAPEAPVTNTRRPSREPPIQSARGTTRPARRRTRRPASPPGGRSRRRRPAPPHWQRRRPAPNSHFTPRPVGRSSNTAARRPSWRARSCWRRGERCRAGRGAASRRRPGATGMVSQAPTPSGACCGHPDVEHSVGFFGTTLGWTTSRARHPEQADLGTWIERLYASLPGGSVVVCIDEMGPLSVRPYPGRGLVRGR